jgi:hypothetical protein
MGQFSYALRGKLARYFFPERYNSKENENKRRGITINHLKKMVEKD